MIQRIKDIFEFAAKTGWYFPGAYDAISEKPSVTLLLVHLTSYLAIAAIIVLLMKDIVAGTVAATGYSCMMMVFYMLRKLTSAKFDADDRSFELSNEEKSETK